MPLKWLSGSLVVRFAFVACASCEEWHCFAYSVVERFDMAVDPRAARRNVDQASLVLAELLQRARNQLRSVVHPNTFGGPPANVNAVSSSVTRHSAAIERSTMFIGDSRECSSIIESILMALPSVVESN
jgi:hypothetical protein